MIEMGYIQKVEEVGPRIIVQGFELPPLPIGFIVEFVKGHTPPPGWVWFDPKTDAEYADSIPPVGFTDEGAEQGTVRIEILCFDDRRAGQVCPCPDECDETNKCLVMLLRDKGFLGG